MNESRFRTYLARGASRLKIQLREALQHARGIGLLDLATSMGLVMVLGFVQNLALARILGSEGFGHVAVVNAAMGFGQLFGALGITVAVLRHSSAQTEEDKAWAIYRTGLPIVLVSSVGVGVLLMFVTYSPFWVFDRQAGDWIPLAVLGLPASILFLLNSKYLQSRQKMREKAVLDFANRVLVVVCIVLGTLFDGFRGFIIGGLVGVLAGAAISTLRIARVRPQNRVPSPVNPRKLLTFGLWSVFTGLMGYVLTTADVLCVSAILQDSSSTGLYGLAVVVQRVARIPSLAYLDATFPNLVRQTLVPQNFSSNRNRMQRNMILLAVGTSACIGLVAPTLLPLVFGEDYEGSVNPLLILLVGQVFWSIGAVHGRSLLAHGFVQGNFWASGLSAGVNIAANLLLIPVFGIKGAAIATMISQIIWAVSVTVMCHWIEGRILSKQRNVT